MNIAIDEAFNYITVTTKGTISIDNLSQFDGQIQSLIKLNKHIIFDFKDVIHIDSSSIGVLIMYNSKMQKNNKKLYLTEMNQELNQIFTITGLQKTSLVHSNKQDAIASL